MKLLSITITAVLLAPGSLRAQQAGNTTPSATENNIYKIKEAYLQQVLHNPADKENGDDDNELARFNRWFNMANVRCYPSGNLPGPDALLKATNEVKQSSRSAHKTTTVTRTWQSLGPTGVPTNFNGVGRINCIVIDPNDTSTLYIGAACGGVWVSHDEGTTWYSNCDNFPSMSIADIAVNPRHSDTLFAATGDGYGYENGTYNIFWGGLYTAGVMMSTDTGHTWNTTGLSFIQSQNDIIQKLLIHPNKTSLLLAATRHGVVRSTDAGVTWDTVTPGHIYSMAFRPGSPDTIYAINNVDLIVSYDAGATWATLYAGVNTTNDRCTLAVSPAAPNYIWILNTAENVLLSTDNGATFNATPTSPSSHAHFYGYYDRVLGVDPTNASKIYAFGEYMAKSTNGGSSWSTIDPTHKVHVDNHAVTINPVNPLTIYTGNDGGIAVTHNGGSTWKNLGNGLMISQIYRISSSRQDTSLMLCGLQDNGTFYNNGSAWVQSNAPQGDGMDNAIHPLNDYIQIASYQYGEFAISFDQGASFSSMAVPGAGSASWTAPVVFNPSSADTIYFGMQNVVASYDAGVSFVPLNTISTFPNGCSALAIAPSSKRIIYAADFDHITRTLNGGSTWTVVSAGLPTATLAISNIAVDYNDSLKVYVTMSGYSAGEKVYMSTNGGLSWTNISTGLPNVPADCIAVDSTTPGALFVGTDMGIFYRDSSTTSWAPYGTGLPNVIVDDLDINYRDYTVKAATYGRGVWEARLIKNIPNGTPVLPSVTHNIKLYPNPASTSWKLSFTTQKPNNFTVNLTDLSGRLIRTQSDNDVIDASGLATGVYNVEVISGDNREVIKAMKN